MDLVGVQCPQMDWEAENLPERWRRFQQHVELIFNGPLSSKKEEKKCSYLLIWCGEKGRDIVNTWSGISEEDKKKLTTYFERIEALVEQTQYFVDINSTTAFRAKWKQCSSS